MSEAADAARRRQLLMHTLALVPVGTGQCPDCHQRAEIFSRRQTAQEGQRSAAWSAGGEYDEP